MSKASKKRIVELLLNRGERFSGGSDSEAEQIAGEWDDSFHPEDAKEWMDAGFWCPSTAYCVYIGMGLDKVKLAAKQIKKEEPGSDPIYELCNNDRSLDEFKKAYDRI